MNGIRPGSMTMTTASPIRGLWLGEPRLAELLADPMVTLLMVRDRVAVDDIVDLKAAVRHRRGTPRVHHAAGTARCGDGHSWLPAADPQPA